MTMQEPTLVDERAVLVNGPEDDALDWYAIDWGTAEDDVRRLRQRIFTASQAGDLKRVRSLQKLILRSRANTLVSVRGHGAQCWPRDGGRRREGGVARGVQGFTGRPGAAPYRTMAGPSGQAGVYP